MSGPQLALSPARPERAHRVRTQQAWHRIKHPGPQLGRCLAFQVSIAPRCPVVRTRPLEIRTGVQKALLGPGHCLGHFQKQEEKETCDPGPQEALRSERSVPQIRVEILIPWG